MMGKSKIREVGDIKILCGGKLEPVSELKPNPQNPNRHPDAQVDKLAEIMQKLGVRHRITVSNRSGFIVSGHCRLKAAQKLGMEKYPVEYQDFINEGEELQVLTSDNIIHEFSEMDGQKMADVLVALDDIDADLSLTGLEDQAIEDFIEGPTDTPAFNGEEDDEDAHFQNIDESAYLIIFSEDVEKIKKFRKLLGLKQDDGKNVELQTVLDKLNIKLD